MAVMTWSSWQWHWVFLLLTLAMKGAFLNFSCIYIVADAHHGIISCASHSENLGKRYSGCHEYTQIHKVLGWEVNLRTLSYVYIYICLIAYIYTYIYIRHIYIYIPHIRDGSHSETFGWLLLNKVTSDHLPWFAWTELFSFSGFQITSKWA